MATREQKLRINTAANAVNQWLTVIGNGQALVALEGVDTTRVLRDDLYEVLRVLREAAE